MGKKKIWHFLLVSYYIPVLGGILVYLMKKKADADLAKVCLAGSLINPLTVYFVVGAAEQAAGIFLDSVSFLGLIIAIGLVFNAAAIKSLFPKNDKRFFLPVFWFGLLGALYSYFFAYSKNDEMKGNLLMFFLAQLVIFIPIMVLAAL